LDAEQSRIVLRSFGSTRIDDVPQARESTDGMLGVIVVPRHTVVVQECEKFVPVFLNAFLERPADFGCAIQTGYVVDEMQRYGTVDSDVQNYKNPAPVAGIKNSLLISLSVLIPSIAISRSISSINSLTACSTPG